MSIDKQLIAKFINESDVLLNDETHLEFYMSQHLRMNGLYWTVISKQMIDQEIDDSQKDELVAWIKECHDSDKGTFSPYPGHDCHILSTLSAIQLLIIFDDIEFLTEKVFPKVFQYIKSLQLDNGAFKGDTFTEELDTRYSYNSLHILYYIKKYSPQLFKQNELHKVVANGLAYLKRCFNHDGGFGLKPQRESHGAHVWTSFASFAIWDEIDSYFSKQELEDLKWWLSERQNLDGGLNGRPCKLSDCCYSWWCLASLKLVNYSSHFKQNKLDCLESIDLQKLKQFIVQCQDDVNGGISDRPGNVVDIFHTCFGLTGMSLIEEILGDQKFKQIDPRFCMLKDIIDSN